MLTHGRCHVNAYKGVRLPGAPDVGDGDEIGLEGGDEPLSRCASPLDQTKSWRGDFWQRDDGFQTRLPQVAQIGLL